MRRGHHGACKVMTKEELKNMHDRVTLKCVLYSIGRNIPSLIRKVQF